MPISGLWRSSSSRPQARRKARCGVRSRPSMTMRERYSRFTPMAGPQWAHHPIRRQASKLAEGKQLSRSQNRGADATAMQDVLRKKKKKTLTLRRIAWALGRRNSAARQRELSEVRRHAPGASATVPGGRSAYVRFALIATELMQRREVTRGAKAA